MRLAGRQRLGFYPLPIAEAKRIRRFLRFPVQECSAFDPCIGDGAAFAEITSDKKFSRYGIELEAGRAEQARSKGIEVIHGNCFDVQCPVESFSLIYLNPPYDFEISEEKSQRMEKLFLDHVYRWLKLGGHPFARCACEAHSRLRRPTFDSFPRHTCLPAHGTGMRAVPASRFDRSTPQSAGKGPSA
jgi:hypothetical protein